MRFCCGRLSPKKRRNIGSSNNGWEGLLTILVVYRLATAGAARLTALA